MMKKFLPIGILALTAAISLPTFAIPAKPGLRTVTAPNGEEYKVRLVGDEYYHQYFTEDGYPLIQKDGEFYYCDITNSGDIVDSGIRAGKIAGRDTQAKDFLSKINMQTLESRIQKRSQMTTRRQSVAQSVSVPMKAPQRALGLEGPPYEQGYGLFPPERGSQFPSYGDQKALVILVEYQDVKFHTDYLGGVSAGDYFTRMLNEDGFSDYGGTGGAAEYFRTQSENAFRPQFDVYGPITLSKNMASYGGNDWSGNDKDPAAMVVEACDQLNATVDFSQYDRDGDGYIDNVFVFYAGRGEASGGTSDTVWPHSWTVSAGGYPNKVYDGVKLDRYGCSNEWESGRPDGVGTFVHEFSHVMGLPDLYATSYTGAFTPGEWSALDYGPYNNDGMTPPNYSAFERYALGWIKPREITEAVSATLQPIDENVCGIIRTNLDNEFFLLENRQKTGWDRFIPGHGMLIWHIDYNNSVWTNNRVNNTSSHQYVDIEEADGTQTDGSRDGDPFPGTANKRTFTADTAPAMKTWKQVRIDFPITNISEGEDGNITFDVLGGATINVPKTTANAAEDVTFEGFTAKWNKVDGYEHLLSVYQKAEDGTKSYLPGLKNRNVLNADSYYVTGVEANQEYFYTVTVTSGWFTGTPSDEVQVITGKMTIDHYAPEALAATDVTGNSFVANWTALEDATEYFVNVYTKEFGAPLIDICDFTDGVQNLPPGWSTSSGSGYSMKSYSGEAVPSLRLAGGQFITTPNYEDGVKEISFWHRGNASGVDDVIEVMAYTPSGNEILTKVPVETTAGGKIVTVTDIPEDTYRVRLLYFCAADNGCVAIDDIKVGHGVTYENVAVADYADKSYGNNLKGLVKGLNMMTDYYYTVTASDGVRKSMVSNEMHVTTKESGASVDHVNMGAFCLEVAGLQISCSGNELIEVYDYSGMNVAKGFGMVTLPRAGLYIVKVPARGYLKKVAIR